MLQSMGSRSRTPLSDWTESSEGSSCRRRDTGLAPGAVTPASKPLGLWPRLGKARAQQGSPAQRKVGRQQQAEAAPRGSAAAARARPSAPGTPLHSHPHPARQETFFPSFFAFKVQGEQRVGEGTSWLERGSGGGHKACGQARGLRHLPLVVGPGPGGSG